MEVIYQVNNLENNLVLMAHTGEEYDNRFTPNKEIGWESECILCVSRQRR